MKRILVFVLIVVSQITLAEIKIKEKVIDFNGYWKFEIGDDSTYKDAQFDDANWDEIYVPSSWEDEGFPGYDGYAWYRLTFFLEPELEKEKLVIKLGPIDDVDQTFLNGKLVGSSGGFPPNYYTNAFNGRQYLIPPNILKYGEMNTIAIRVYDFSGTGGLIRGNFGIFSYEERFNPEINLVGYWKFKTGDNQEWTNPDYKDDDWDEIFVPAKWDLFGYQHHDGFGWYRKKVIIDEIFDSEKLILLVGKIDDYDEVFFNGTKIGGTGNIKENTEEIRIIHNIHLRLRAYFIPKNLIKYGEENTIAVRVYDGLTFGGIFEGPVGIITRDKYLHEKRKYENPFKSFIESLFN